MKKVVVITIFFALLTGDLLSQSKGIKTITEDELRYHLDFLGTKEFRGRETPSPELDIASVYISNWAKYNGLNPLMKDGSFYQNVPLNVVSVSQPGTKLTIVKDGIETVWHFGKSFGSNFTTNGSYSGSVIFAGSNIEELKDVDLRGKVIVVIDDDRFSTNGSEPNPWLSTRLAPTSRFLRERGASALLAIASPEKQARIATPSDFYDYIPVGRLDTTYQTQITTTASTTTASTSSASASSSQRPPMPFAMAEINHTLASVLLGISENEVKAFFADQRAGKTLKTKEYRNSFVRLDVVVNSYKDSARNVLAVIEGSDPVLKNEYVVVSSHYDGRGIDDGEIIPGADDNMSGVVAMFEIGQALMVEKPKRSVIFAWFCGEEQMLHGSHYFVNNCPVPVEKISACINLDMLTRNHTDSLYLICSDNVSSELDKAIVKANNTQGIRFGFDYIYSDFSHEQRLYTRSDHYPFMRFGIPAVWIFTGLTNDYHTYRDALEFVDYAKFFKATKLTYLTIMEVGNAKELLKLDVNSAVTSRGAHNLNEASLYQRR